MDLRGQLEDLARRLHLIDDDEHAAALRADVQRSLEQEPHDHSDLSRRLEQSAVHFETRHPDIADAVRRVADALAASGL